VPQSAGCDLQLGGSLRRILNPQAMPALLLDIIGEEAESPDRMVGDLLDYSRPVQPALQPVAPAALRGAIRVGAPAGGRRRGKRRRTVG